MNNNLISNKPKTEAKDYAYAILKGGIASIPVAGDVAAELLTLIVASPLDRRKDEWIDSIAQGLVDLQEQIDGFRLEDLAEKEVFITTMMKASHTSMRNHQNEKLEALRNAVLNSVLPNAPDEDLQQIFVTLVDDLTTWHLRILKLFENPRAFVGEKAYSLQEELLLDVYPELKGRKDFFDKICADLGTYGLAGISLRTKMTPYGVLSPRTSTIGKQFIRFISTPSVLK